MQVPDVSKVGYIPEFKLPGIDIYLKHVIDKLGRYYWQS